MGASIRGWLGLWVVIMRVISCRESPDGSWCKTIWEASHHRALEKMDLIPRRRSFLSSVCGALAATM